PCPTNQPVVASCDGPLTALLGSPGSTQVTASDPDGTVTTIATEDVSPSPAPGSITLGGDVAAPEACGTAHATVTVDSDTPRGSAALHCRSPPAMTRRRRSRRAARSRSTC